MSLFPELRKMGPRWGGNTAGVMAGMKNPVRIPAKRALHDVKAGRRAVGLVIRLAATGEALCATKSEVAFAGGELPAMDGHALYDRVRLERFWKWVEEVEAPRLAEKGFGARRIAREVGRTFRMRFQEGRWEREVMKELCPAR